MEARGKCPVTLSGVAIVALDSKNDRFLPFELARANVLRGDYAFALADRGV